MDLRLRPGAGTEIRWPAPATTPALTPVKAAATAPGPHKPVDETPGDAPDVAGAAGVSVAAGASPGDFSIGPPASLRPADPLVGSVVNTMLAIYRAKYGLDVGTIQFQAHLDKAAEVRGWCNNMEPGECGLLLAGTSRGMHTFVLLVGRSADGTARCLMVDSSGPCMGAVKLALQRQFGPHVYSTPVIQGTRERGCMVFAMRFLLMSRNPELGARALRLMEDFDQRHDDMDEGLLQLADMAPLAGWLAVTRHRDDVEQNALLPKLKLNNGGRHARWTLEEFFDRRPANLVTDVRDMYDQVDRLAQNLPNPGMHKAERAYLKHRFLRHLED